MKKYIIVCSTGLQGVTRYDTYEEAEEAANIRMAFTLYKWYVKEVIGR